MKQSNYNIFTQTIDGINLLFNTFTQGLVEVEEENVEKVKNIIENPMVDYDDPELAEMKKFLIENFFLIEDSMDEMAVIKTRNFMRRFDKTAFQMVILPTMDCNFACKYCYENRTQGFISEAAQKGIMEWIDTITSNFKVFSLGWFGGEPLLGFDIIEKINRHAIERCKEKDVMFHCSITTNGYLLTDEVIAKLDELNVNNMQITLDGVAKYHDQYRPLRNGGPTFDVVYNNILKVLDRTKVEVQVRVNIDQDNWEMVRELLEYIPENYRKANLRIYFRNIFESAAESDSKSDCTSARQKRLYSYKEIRKLYNLAMKMGYKATFPVLTTKDIYCESCIMNHYVILPTGKIARCTVGMEDDKVIGEITEEGIVDINFAKVADWMGRGPADDEKCKKCKFLPMCLGGCRNQRIKDHVPCPYESQDIGAIAEQIYLEKTFSNGEVD